MRASLALRAAAERDLRQIADYSLVPHGNKAKDAYLAGLSRAFDRLRDFPELGATCDDLHCTLHCLASRKHLIYYTYTNGNTSILRSLRQAMDVGRW